jgi:hemoglobin-like flavoprotein
MMIPDQVELVQSSFAKVAPIADEAAKMFYERLFAIAPGVKPLFKGDMAEQRRKLVAMLVAVVNGLSDLNAILPAASTLAKRHVSYGVEASHYDSVGEALLWTLERGLGPAWTKDVAQAWTDTYTILADFMIAEAYGRPVAAE